MGTTIYVVNPDPAERRWVEAVLAPSADAVVFFADAAALLAHRAIRKDAVLVAATEPAGAGALELVRELRRRGVSLPVIALGPYTAFRTAVDMARLEGTNFLERPITARELRAAVRKASKGSSETP